MPLFSSNPPEETPEAQKRRLDSIAAVRAGGLPLNATDRLTEQAQRRNTPEALFTSDLSVNELLAVRRGGYEPLGQVMGSSIYLFGMGSGGGITGEMQFLTKAYNDIRERALDRLRQEAELLGATHVVGVRLKQTRFAWGEGLMEVTAIGTAVRDTSVRRAETVALSALSGTELWTLRQAGYTPVGLVVGNCAYYGVGKQYIRPTAGQLRTRGFGWGYSQERKDYTDAVYGARSIAMGRMEQQARDLRAEGVVGVTVDVEIKPSVSDVSYGSIYCHFVAIGTAIVSSRSKPPENTPEITLNLTG